MIYYKNISFSTKTFYGVKFNPGETKGVPGYINNAGMFRVKDATVISTQSSPTSSTKSTRTKKRRSDSKMSAETIVAPVVDIETSNTQIDLINNIEEELENGSDKDQ